MSKNVFGIWFLVFGLWSVAISVSGQVRLTQIEKDTTKWRVPVAHRVVPGQSGYFLKYMTAPALFDSLGIELYDSIYVVTGVSKDTIKLRDGSGYALVDKALVNGVKGTGTATRVAWWGGTDSLSSDDKLYWDNTNKRLGVNEANPSRTLSVNGNILAGDNSSNLYIGRNNNMNGSNNFGLGTNTLAANLSINRSVGIGTSAIYSKTSGFGDVAIGFESLYSDLGGGTNIAIGDHALRNSNTLGGVTAIGFQSGYDADGYHNTFIGRESGHSATGNFLTAIGLSAGRQAGDSGVFIGWNAGYYETGHNKLYIETSNSGTPLIGGDFGTDKVGINTSIGSIARTLTVGGELRVTDLNTDPATKLLGADNDGDVSSVTVGNGLNIDAGTLTVTANINGTQNRVAKFTSQYAVGNSEIYTVGDTLVGINQSNPQYHLDVFGKFRVTNRTGTAATGAGFTSDGQLISYSLDTAEATPNTYIQSGTSINITGSGTMGDPYTINNSAPENTSVKDGTHLDFSELTNDTITATIIASSIGPTELASTAVSPGTYNYATITVDQDGRITSASGNTDQQGVTSVSGTSPIISTGGSTPTISINQSTAVSNGYLSSTDWTTFNNKIGGSGTTNYISKFTAGSTLGNSLLFDNGSTVAIGTTSPDGNARFLIKSSSPVIILEDDTGAKTWFHGKAGGTSNSFGIYSETSGAYRAQWSSSGVMTVPNLAGSGTRMVTASSTGALSTQTIPTGVISLNGLSGSIFLSTGNSGTYPNWSSSGSTLIYNLPSGSSGQVLKHNGTGWTAGTDNNTDAQTLSFSSPNLSISGGNSVALPVLPTGTATSNTLRWSGSAWAETSMLKTTTARVDINSWPGTVNLGSKLLVNGHIQYTNTGFQASTLTGRDTDGGLTGVTVGSGLSLSGGTLSNSGVTSITAGSGISVNTSTGAVTVSNSPVYGECNYQGPSGSITGSWTSISFNQTAKANGMTTGSGGVTIPATGRYRVDASVQGNFTANSLTGYSGMAIRMAFAGGLKYTRSERVYHSNSQIMDLTVTHSYIEDFTAGNVVGIDVQSLTNSGATLTIGSANVIVTKLF